MLEIKHIDELRQKVAHKEEIRENSVGEGLTCFCYMIAGDETFDDSWSRECRGIVFNRHGKVASRPFHKFFNVNEREETQLRKLDWSKVARVMDKRDGSMIHTVIDAPQVWPDRPLRDRIKFKSKKSFDSSVAQAARQFMFGKDNIWAMIEYVSLVDCTLIFEWTSPDARIVLYYPNSELRLLHIRHNQTGEYWSGALVREMGYRFNCPVVDDVQFDVPRERLGEHLIELAATAENIEGWVVQFENGEMVKLKTTWYLQRHRAMTFLRVRDIAVMVLEQSLDDLKSLLVTEGVDIVSVIEIENRVIDDLRNIERTVKGFAAPEDFAMNRKDFVFKHREKAGQYFGLLMNLYSTHQPGFEGKLPNYLEFFRDNILKQQYDLRQLNLVPSVAEAE